jgi:hypothetical protein
MSFEEAVREKYEAVKSAADPVDPLDYEWSMVSGGGGTL